MSNEHGPEMKVAELEERVKNLTNALVDMVNQFVYDDGTSYNEGMDKYAESKINSGGLSALEFAFDILDLDDPCTRRDLWNKDIREEMEEM